MQEYLLCLMSLVDLSVNSSVSDERRLAAHHCAYLYKQYLTYSVCTEGCAANQIKANSYKESALEYAKICRLILHFEEV